MSKKRSPGLLEKVTMAALAKRPITTMPEPEAPWAEDIESARAMTDAENARIFVEKFKTTTAFVTQLNDYANFERGRWRTSTGLITREKIQETSGDYWSELCKKSRNDAQRRQFEKFALYSQSAPGVQRILTMAAPYLQKDLALFDAHPYLFNCVNFTVDLKNGALIAHRPDHLLTQVSSFNFDAKAECPKFDKFLNEIMCGRTEMVEYLWRVFGCMLTGDASDRAFFILHGCGRNGKSTLLNTWHGLLGDYSHKAQAKSFIENFSHVNSDVAHMREKRFVWANEAEESQTLNASKIKELTGDETINARHLYGREFSFFPQFKPFLSTNDVPKISDTTESLSSRWNSFTENSKKFLISLRETRRGPLRNLAT